MTFNECPKAPGALPLDPARGLTLVFSGGLQLSNAGTANTAIDFVNVYSVGLQIACVYSLQQVFGDTA